VALLAFVAIVLAVVVAADEAVEGQDALDAAPFGFVDRVDINFAARLVVVQGWAIDRQTTSTEVPLWAKQMEIFILEDMNELDAARALIGGLLERGEIHDPNELRFLQQRLEELDRRLKVK